MTITLTPRLRKYLNEQVKAGRYASVDDVVAAGVAKLIQEEAFGDFNPGELDAMIEQAEREIRRGDVVDAGQVFDETHRMSRAFRRKPPNGEPRSGKR